MKIHFIGIGGIGVSALAQYYLSRGCQVFGSDIQESEITKALQKKGVKVFIGHKAKNLAKSVDLVVHTSATPEDNPELLKAKKLQATSYKLQVLTYSKALGSLTKKYFTIAVAGTHGKSTTTAMVSLILIKAGLDPTVIVGAKLKEFGDSNFRMGIQSPVASRQSPVFVIEACEHEKAFLDYWPKIIVITNIEKEHLDYYKNLRNILSAFKKFVLCLPKSGFLIANKDDKNIQNIISNQIKNPEFKIRRYSLSQKKDAKKLKKILKIPGRHNIQNALGALAVARILKISDKVSFEALAGYRGIWRRFEIFSAVLNAERYTLISDYAHHPTEIKATLQAAREKFKKRRIVLVFQPHQYKRTKLFFNDFVKCFDEADFLILNEIYGVEGREKEKEISSENLAAAIQKRWQKLRYKNKNVIFVKNQKSILKKLSEIIKRKDALIVMGAGDIYNLTVDLTKTNKNIKLK